MNTSIISFAFQGLDWPETIKFIASNVLLPILVAAVTYLLIDQLGEYKKRRTYCRLGIAIIESLLEEIRTGINVMTDALNAANDINAKGSPVSMLPKGSWNGMSTIPDDVLLRIIEASNNKKSDGLPPREIRIHCKNYFEHMNRNYEQILTQAEKLAATGQDWRNPIRILLADDYGHYISATRNVDKMLSNAKQLLEDNSKAWFPK